MEDFEKEKQYLEPNIKKGHQQRGTWYILASTFIIFKSCTHPLLTICTTTPLTWAMYWYLFHKLCCYPNLSSWSPHAGGAIVGSARSSLPGVCVHPQQLWASAMHPSPKNGPQHVGKCLGKGASPLNVTCSQCLNDTYKRPAPLPWGEIKLWCYARSRVPCGSRCSLSF